MTMLMVIVEMVAVMPHVAHHSLPSLLTALSAKMVVDGSSCGCVLCGKRPYPVDSYVPKYIEIGFRYLEFNLWLGMQIPVN